jgi:Ca2+ transporting ATPase
MVLELPGGRRRLVSKGASEMILAACNMYHSKEGQVMNIDDMLREKMEKAIELMAG